MATDSKGFAAGIVINSHTISVLEMNVQRGRTEITARGSVETPPGAVEGAEVIDPTRVAQAIRGLRRDTGMKGSVVTVAVDSPGYSLRSVRLPDVPAREQRQLVRGELEQVGALPVGTGAFDFVWLPAPTLEGKKQADAAAYYSNDANIDAIRSAIRQSGLQLGGIEPASLAMMRAAVSGMEERRPVALLYVAGKHSDLLIHDGTMPRHIRRIPAGWDELTRAEETVVPIGSYGDAPTQGPPRGGSPAPGPGFSYEEEADPLTSAAPAYARSGSPADVGSSRMDAGNGLQASSVPFLAAEVSRSLAFYAREYGDAPQPEVLLVLGARQGAADVRTILRDYIAIPVDDRDVLAGFPLPPALGRVGEEDHAATLATLGAAFSDASAPIPAIDISQQEALTMARKRAPTVLLAGMAASTVWMLAAVAGSLALTFLEMNATAEIARIDAEISRINEERAPKLRRFAITEATKLAASKSRVPASSILGRIAASTTPGVGVTAIRIARDGTAEIDGEAVNEQSMERFAENLSRNYGTTPSINSISYKSFKEDARTGITFTLMGYYRGSAADAQQ